MLTKEQNHQLTHVQPDTAAGRLLRAYWLPIAHPEQLARRNPAPVEVLGEKLALFRTADGVLGLTTDRCAHRGTSLSAGDPDMKTAGRIDRRGVRCPYHGWLYGPDGQCLDMPGDPNGEAFARKIKIRAYKVVERYGFIWAFLGEGEPPVLPPIDAMARTDGFRVNTMTDWPCNYLQVCENLVDPVHVSVLHEETDFDDAVFREMPTISAHPTDLGLRIISGRPGYERQTEYVFPTGIRIALPFIKPGVQLMFWVVPLSDTRTRSFHAWFLPREEGISDEEWNARLKRLDGFLYQYGKDDPLFHSSKISAQDKFACESQGAITDRSVEHLGRTDVGVSLLRRLLREAARDIDEGRRPRGTAVGETVIRFENVF